LRKTFTASTGQVTAQTPQPMQRAGSTRAAPSMVIAPIGQRSTHASHPVQSLSETRAKKLLLTTSEGRADVLAARSGPQQQAQHMHRALGSCEAESWQTRPEALPLFKISSASADEIYRARPFSTK
jgi:hypothetical protein